MFGDIDLVYDHFGKNIKDEKLRNILCPCSFDGVCLPNRKDCIELINSLKWFLESYTDQEINNINNDVFIVLNGGQDIDGSRPSYLPHLPKSILKKKRKQSPGYIYFLQDDTGRIKIGKTKELNKRIFHIGIHLPTVPILFHSFKTSDTTTSEKSLHEKYKDHRLGGEWFNIPKEELPLIKRMGTT